MNKQYTPEPRVGMWIVITTIAVIIILALLNTKNSTKSKTSRTNREVALTCTTDMATEFHIHPNLEIIINGQKQELIKNIGVGPTCMTSLHTHDNSGVVHVESPEKRDFILADFFAVWKKTFNKDEILDYKTDEKHMIRMTINGSDVQNYENTILLDKDQIIIYYEEKK